MNQDEKLGLREKLGAWLDGELDADEAARVEALLQSDVAAQKEVARLRKINRVGTTDEVPAVTAAEWAQRWDQIAAEIGATASGRVPASAEGVAAPRFSLVTWVAALAAVLLLTFVLGRRRGIQPPVEHGVTPVEHAAPAATGDASSQWAKLEGIEWNDDAVDVVMQQQIDEDSFIVYVYLNESEGK